MSVVRSLARGQKRSFRRCSHTHERIRLLDDPSFDESPVGLLPVGDDVPRLVRIYYVGDKRVVEGSPGPGIVAHAVGNNEVENLGRAKG